MGLFFIALAVAYLLGNGYIYFRSWEVLHLVPTAVRWAFSLLYWAGACSLFFVFGNREMPVGAMSHALYYLSTGWLVFTLYLVMLLLGTDLLRLFHIQFPYRFIICLFQTNVNTLFMFRKVIVLDVYMTVVIYNRWIVPEFW